MLRAARFASSAVVAMFVGSLTVSAQEGAKHLHHPPVTPHFSDVPLYVGPGATTVQLPTFNFFTISTSVMVPDRGGAYLGGVNSGGSASHSNGLPGLANRSGASSLGAGGVSVGVQVIDLAEMDRALLAEARAKRESAEAEIWVNRVERARQSSAGLPTISVAEARRLRAAAGQR